MIFFLRAYLNTTFLMQIGLWQLGGLIYGVHIPLQEMKLH